MPDKDFLFFNSLKKDLVKKVQETYPETGSDISSWKGKEIHLFQEDLEAQANGRISEKSFYTHFKSENSKLPRIDVLDLLSQYVGYDDWIAYIRSTQLKVNYRKYLRVGMAIAGSAIIVLLVSFLLQPKTYSISIVNAYSNRTVPAHQFKIIQLFDDQSPKEISGNGDSIFSLKTDNAEVKFIVEAPYFHKDTIIRKIGFLQQHEVVRLFPNDYALIIHSLSNSVDEDWNRRRAQLAEMISDNARIFQFSSAGNIAIEMYNKHEFINKLTIPVNSLRNIEIIDIRFENELISELRFIQEKGGTND